jgi:hypothetical protein
VTPHVQKLLACAGLLALQGCSVLSLELGEPLDTEVADAFEPGRTQRAEVLDALGPPSSLGAHAGGVVLLYEHILLQEQQLGLSMDGIGAWIGASWLGMFKIALGGSGTKREAAVLFFDEANVLTGAAAGDWEELFGKGGSFQLFFAVEQVVDSADLRRTLSSLSWGRRLLDPLPRQLNWSHVPDVELRNTPTNMGQRTLEQRRVAGEEP